MNVGLAHLQGRVLSCGSCVHCITCDVWARGRTCNDVNRKRRPVRRLFCCAPNATFGRRQLGAVFGGAFLLAAATRPQPAMAASKDAGPKEGDQPEDFRWTWQPAAPHRVAVSALQQICLPRLERRNIRPASRDTDACLTATSR